MGKYTLELAKVAGPVLAAIAGAWLQARYGRKVRLKIGDKDEPLKKLNNLSLALRTANRAFLLSEVMRPPDKGVPTDTGGPRESSGSLLRRLIIVDNRRGC